jgi:hypothetical protein
MYMKVSSWNRKHIIVYYSNWLFFACLSVNLNLYIVFVDKRISVDCILPQKNWLQFLVWSSVHAEKSQHRLLKGQHMLLMIWEQQIAQQVSCCILTFAWANDRDRTEGEWVVDEDLGALTSSKGFLYIALAASVKT